MSETKAASGGLTRRSFLKTTGAVAGALAVSGALVGCSEQDAAVGQSGSERIKVPTTCMGNCHGFACPLDVFVQDGKVVDVQTFVSEEHPDYHSVCLRGYTNIERMYAQNRIKYPMRRVEGTPRGGGEWERISWDEAIDEQLAENSFDLAVVIIGINDRQPIKVEGQSYEPLTPQWTTAYQARITAFLNKLRAGRKPVIWVGLPPMAKGEYSAAISQISNIQ